MIYYDATIIYNDNTTTCLWSMAAPNPRARLLGWRRITKHNNNNTNKL